MMTFLSACGTKVSESVVADRTFTDRQECADALADGFIGPAQVQCLEALEGLSAGFGEETIE
jgi:hypothetical protein